MGRWYKYLSYVGIYTIPAGNVVRRFINLTSMAKERVEFDWQTLLKRIRNTEIIPVIGPEVHTINSSQKLLYDSLAETLAKDESISPNSDKHNFLKVNLEYLKANPDDKKVLSNKLKKLAAVPPNRFTFNLEHPLIKLARIKNFNFIISITYDNSLHNAVRWVRKGTSRSIAYNTGEHETLHNIDYESIENTTILNIFGKFGLSNKPALTESDVLEAITTFNQASLTSPNNRFIQFLKDRKFLFIGCNYKNWLSRFFIRTISNKKFQVGDPPKDLFFGSDFSRGNDESDFESDLLSFLKDHQSSIYPGKSLDFVDMLYQELEKEEDQIIEKEDFPSIAFLSFMGSDKDGNEVDRKKARMLAESLRDKGLPVWFDEKEREVGNEISEQIKVAIRKSTVFMPLFSKTACEQDGYHKKEWKWVDSQMDAYPVGSPERPRLFPITVDGSVPRVEDYFPSVDEVFWTNLKDGDPNSDAEEFKKLIKQLITAQDGNA